MPRFNLGMALRHPVKAMKYYGAYKSMNSRLAELLGEDTDKIQKYTAEFESKTELFSIIEDAVNTYRLGDLSGAARMIKAPVQYVTTRVLQPDYIVETGVGAGISDMFYLEALRVNAKGELHSIDLPRQAYKIPEGVHQDYIPEEKEPGWLIPKNLRDRWHLHLGDAKVELPRLVEKLGTIDIFMHDSEHTYEFMTFEFRTAWPRLRKGGVLLSDDINWNSSFTDFAKEVGANAVSFVAFGGMRKV
ncbi:class I SAM-dependent methyltransferase [Nitrososphaera sp.]|uniref:class I SAM-dependent methyltransferase n=1 Tax=Nitrososphaera sp. TaxID=1971748 RepID=UPI003180D1F1